MEPAVPLPQGHTSAHKTAALAASPRTALRPDGLELTADGKTGFDPAPVGLDASLSDQMLQSSLQLNAATSLANSYVDSNRSVHAAPPSNVVLNPTMASRAAEGARAARARLEAELEMLRTELTWLEEEMSSGARAQQQRVDELMAAVEVAEKAAKEAAATAEARVAEAKSAAEGVRLRSEERIKEMQMQMEKAEETATKAISLQAEAEREKMIREHQQEVQRLQKLADDKAAEELGRHERAIAEAKEEVRAEAKVVLVNEKSRAQAEARKAVARVER